MSRRTRAKREKEAMLESSSSSEDEAPKAAAGVVVEEEEGSEEAASSGSGSPVSTSSEDEKEGVKRCELCWTTQERTNLHHLVPKLILKRRKNKGRAHVTVLARLCKTCHHTLHEKFTHAELAKGFSSVEEIEQRPEMAAYLEWKRKKR